MDSILQVYVPLTQKVFINKLIVRRYVGIQYTTKKTNFSRFEEIRSRRS